MSRALQDIVYRFFTEATGTVSLHNGIRYWQASLGYISPSITQNWMAIAQDHDIRYLGDIDMQNGFATGRYVIDQGYPLKEILLDSGVYRIEGQPTGKRKSHYELSQGSYEFLGRAVFKDPPFKQVDAGLFFLRGEAVAAWESFASLQHGGYELLGREILRPEARVLTDLTIDFETISPDTQDFTIDFEVEN